MVNETSTFWIAIYGGLLSTGLLIFQIITYRLQNTPRLKVDVDKAKVYAPSIYSNNQNLILVKVANIGKKTVTITNFGFEFNRVRGADYMAFGSPDLPRKLEEGDTHSIQIDRDYFKKQLSEQPKEAQMPKYAWVKDHGGKKYKSINISKIPHVYKELKID